jgi:hypothetical protein
VALKPKAKSFELDILSEAETAQDRIDIEPRDNERPPRATVLRGRWLAGIDLDKLPKMSKEEEDLFNRLRIKGSYGLVHERGGNYYIGLGRKALNKTMVKRLIKRGWLAKSAYNKGVAYFVTSLLVYAWCERIGLR